MIFTLVEHCHLKKKIKGVGLKVPVLVGEDGSVIVPQSKVMGHEKFEEKAGKQSFDIRPEDCAVKGDYEGLFNYMRSTFSIDREKACKILTDAQSLTIRHLIATFNIHRPEAKILMASLVQYKAYVKYFSYWRRTKEFTVWLLEHKA